MKNIMYIKVIVKASMKSEEIVEKTKDHFEISVKEKAKNNMANRKVIELIAQYFKVTQNKVRIINGHHHPHKLLIIEN